MYDKAETEDDMPDNVLLFGDASFDNKGIGVVNNRYSDQNFVPTFQSEYSFKLGTSYCTDDFIAYLCSDCFSTASAATIAAKRLLKCVAIIYCPWVIANGGNCSWF